MNTRPLGTVGCSSPFLPDRSPTDRPRNWRSLHAAFIVAFVFPVAFSACALSMGTQSSRILAGRAVDNYYIINIKT